MGFSLQQKIDNLEQKIQVRTNQGKNVSGLQKKLAKLRSRLGALGTVQVVVTGALVLGVAGMVAPTPDGDSESNSSSSESGGGFAWGVIIGDATSPSPESGSTGSSGSTSSDGSSGSLSGGSGGSEPNYAGNESGPNSGTGGGSGDGSSPDSGGSNNSGDGNPDEDKDDSEHPYYNHPE
jgi:hypothetical protein